MLSMTLHSMLVMKIVIGTMYAELICCALSSDAFSMQLVQCFTSFVQRMVGLKVPKHAIHFCSAHVTTTHLNLCACRR